MPFPLRAMPCGQRGFAPLLPLGSVHLRLKPPELPTGNLESLFSFCPWPCLLVWTQSDIVPTPLRPCILVMVSVRPHVRHSRNQGRRLASVPLSGFGLGSEPALVLCPERRGPKVKTATPWKFFLRRALTGRAGSVNGTMKHTRPTIG